MKNVHFFWDVTAQILVNNSRRFDGMQFSPCTALPVALNIRNPRNYLMDNFPPSVTLATK
jgi:hypothetical protein